MPKQFASFAVNLTCGHPADNEQHVGAAIRDVLGWGAGEAIGKRLADFVTGSSPQEVGAAIDAEMRKVLAAPGGSGSGSSSSAHRRLASRERTPDAAVVPPQKGRTSGSPTPPSMQMAQPASGWV